MLAPCSEAHAVGPFLDIARQSLALWPELASTLLEETGVDCELVLDGLLRVAFDAGDAEELDRRVTWQREQGIDVELVDPATARALEPAIADGVVAAAWYPREGHVHSPRAVRALVAALHRRGVEVRTGTPVAGVSPGGGIRLAGGESIPAAVVVLAAGAQSGDLAASLGAAPLPVRPVRGQLIGLRCLPLLPRRVVFGGLLGYALAKRDGVLLVGATEEEAGHDARVTASATETLLGTARRLIRGAGDATPAHAWAGLRPATPDGLPLLGELATTAATRLVVAAGHYRNGVLLAPVTADGIATLALEGTSPAGWQPFDPRRFN
jgi:glycine oxidase